MARSPTKFRRAYWDSCTWISLIQNETSVPLAGDGTDERVALARAVIDDSTKKAAEIVTSTLGFSEVIRPSVARDGVAEFMDKLAEFFENDFIVVVMLGRHIGELARTLMQRWYPGLKPLDAVDLAFRVGCERG